MYMILVGEGIWYPAVRGVVTAESGLVGKLRNIFLGATHSTIPAGLINGKACICLVSFTFTPVR